MNEKKRILFFAILIFIAIASAGQTKTVKKAIKNKEKVERTEDRKYEKSKKEAIKRHKKIQHKETQKMMKEADKRAKNNRSKDGFLDKLFANRKRKKSKK